MNFLSVALVIGLASLMQLVFDGVNPLMTFFYVIYLSLLLGCGLAITHRVSHMDLKTKTSLVFWILLGDLLLNAPSFLLELILSGPGDMVTGLSGLLIKESLSQNRTNSMRAGFLIILCLVNLRSSLHRLVKVSLIFNVLVILLAVSMTTIFSAISAISIFLFLRMNVVRFLPYCGIGIVFAIIADKINFLIFRSTSVFQFMTELNVRWIPKLDIYSHFFGEMAIRNPLTLWIGVGIGNFSNRFAMLTNFQLYSNYPFKEQISAVFSSPVAVEHLIDRYGLEREIVGASIISVPWNGIMALFSEWGLLGIALLGIAGLPWFLRIWRSRKSKTYQLLLVLFLGLNLLFDCYLDYPEVVVPFLVILAILSAEDISQRQKAQFEEAGGAITS